jgi:hypothetical protein
MPYQLSWWVKDRVIVEKFWGDFTDEDVSMWEQEILPMLEQTSSPKVHLLLEIADVHSLPSIGAIRQMSIPSHPKIGWVVVYGLRKNYVRALLLFTVLLFNMHYKIVDNQHQALAFLAELDALIPK